MTLPSKGCQFYVGLARDGAPDNFVVLSPKRTFIRLEARLPKSDEVDRRLEEAGLDVMPYTKWGRYRVRVTKEDLAKHQDVVAELLKRAYDNGRSS